ncbi:hypothetical protein OHR68_06365 [Spirillospora sp. NBC_00431]
MSALHGRATRIRDRELTERRDGTALEVMETALASLSNVQQAAALACFLLETGCRDLRLVAEGAV